VGYTAEPSPPCWPRVFLASTHTNTLMIIAKREDPTYRTYNKQQKGNLEPKNSFIMQSYTPSQPILHTSPKHIMTSQTIH